MPQVVETTVYEIDELPDAAKEKARAWYREQGFDEHIQDATIDDFIKICELIGVEIETRPVRTLGGKFRDEARIRYTASDSQSDGAAFSGTYQYAPEATKAIKAHAPKDAELHAISMRLDSAQRANFYGLTAVIKDQSRNPHANNMTIEVERDNHNNLDPAPGTAETVDDALRDLARWLFKQLYTDYEYQQSDRFIDGSLKANEFKFTENGRRFRA